MHSSESVESALGRTDITKTCSFFFVGLKPFRKPPQRERHFLYIKSSWAHPHLPTWSLTFNKTYNLSVNTRFESTGSNSLEKNPNMDIVSANCYQWYTSTNQLLQIHQTSTKRKVIIRGNIMSLTYLVHFSMQKPSLTLLSSLPKWISYFKTPVLLKPAHDKLRKRRRVPCPYLTAMMRTGCERCTFCLGDMGCRVPEPEAGSWLRCSWPFWRSGVVSDCMLHVEYKLSNEEFMSFTKASRSTSSSERQNIRQCNTSGSPRQRKCGKSKD